MSCRLSGIGQLSVTEFDSLACASCFYFIYLVVQPHSQLYTARRCRNGVLVCSPGETNCSCENRDVVYNLPEYALNRSAIRPLSELELNPALPDSFVMITRQCCEAARHCCHNVLLNSTHNTKCPATWDGWQCFGAATPGVVESSCPPYIYGDFSKNAFEQTASKECLASGWGTGGDGLSEWTDYTGCTVTQEDAHLKLLSGIVAYTISVACLIPALLILNLFRPLRKSPMFVLHRHLLATFLFSGLFYLFNCFFFIVDGAPADILYFTNHISCRLLFLVQLRFLRLSTFSWMLGEGVYLYRLLQSANNDGENLAPYKILCWGVPMALSFIYGALRAIFDDVGCWVSPSVFDWIEWTVMAPCLIALTANILIVTFLMYILVKKLRCDPHLERMQYKKAVRAAVMLIPVFGLHFLFTIYRIPSTTHQIINLVLDGLQGCFVALIHCYTNKSVLECAAKWWHDFCAAREVRAECRARTSLQTETKAPLVAL